MKTWQWVGFNIFLEIFPLLGNSFLVGKKKNKTQKTLCCWPLNLSSIFYSKTKVISFIQVSLYLWQANERRQVTTLTQPRNLFIRSLSSFGIFPIFRITALLLPKFHYYIIRALFSLPSDTFFSVYHRISPIETPFRSLNATAQSHNSFRFCYSIILLPGAKIIFHLFFTMKLTIFKLSCLTQQSSFWYHELGISGVSRTWLADLFVPGTISRGHLVAFNR